MSTQEEQREQRRIVAEWVESKIGKCPACGQNVWSFSEQKLVFVLGVSSTVPKRLKEFERTLNRARSPERAMTRGLQNIDGKMECANAENRLVHLSCANCANVLLLDANLILGRSEDQES